MIYNNLKLIKLINFFKYICDLKNNNMLKLSNKQINK